MSVDGADLGLASIDARERALTAPRQPTRGNRAPTRVIDESLVAEAAMLECSVVLQQALEALADEARLRQRLECELRQARSELQETQLRLADAHAEQRHTLHTALHDVLTGLPNRASFHQRSRRALDRGAPGGHKIGLMFIDLDGFKAINDLHGHRIGDELLKVVATRLQRSVRAQDTISRHGGDEFLCLLLDVADEVQVASVARKLFDAVSAPCRLGELTLTVRPSIGIAVYPRDGTTVEQLLENADRAMYAAKRHRAGHAFYTHPNKVTPTLPRLPG